MKFKNKFFLLFPKLRLEVSHLFCPNCFHNDVYLTIYDLTHSQNGINWNIVSSSFTWCILNYSLVFTIVMLHICVIIGISLAHKTHSEMVFIQVTCSRTSVTEEKRLQLNVCKYLLILETMKTTRLQIQDLKFLVYNTNIVSMLKSPLFKYNFQNIIILISIIINNFSPY